MTDHGARLGVAGLLVGLAIGWLSGAIWTGSTALIVTPPIVAVVPTPVPGVTTIYVEMPDHIITVDATSTARPTSEPIDVVLTPNPPITTTPLPTVTALPVAMPSPGAVNPLPTAEPMVDDGTSPEVE